MTKTKKGGYRKTEFTERVKTDPSVAAFDLRVTWEATKSATKAAAVLGISRRSFFRCVDRLNAIGFNIAAPSGTTNPGIDTVRS